MSALSAYVPGLPVDERAASPCRFWRGNAGSPGKRKAMQVTQTGKEFKGQPQVKVTQRETVLLVIHDYCTSGPTRFGTHFIVHVL